MLAPFPARVLPRIRYKDRLLIYLTGFFGYFRVADLLHNKFFLSLFYFNKFIQCKKMHFFFCNLISCFRFLLKGELSSNFLLNMYVWKIWHFSPLNFHSALIQANNCKIFIWIFYVLYRTKSSGRIWLLLIGGEIEALSRGVHGGMSYSPEVLAPCYLIITQLILVKKCFLVKIFAFNHIGLSIF